MSTDLDDTATPTRNALFSWKIICFKVEDEIFSVPRNVFAATSEVFADMFLLPSSGSPDGLDEGHPITLEGYKKDEFVALLKVMYPMPDTIIHGDTLSLDLTKAEWVSALKLSTIWNMTRIRKYAISRLDALQLKPAEKVQLARDHRVGKWLREGVTALTEGEPTPIEDLEALGWKTAALLCFIHNHRTKPQPQSAGRFTMASIKCAYCTTSSSLITAEQICSGCRIKVTPESVLCSPSLGSTTPGTQYNIYLQNMRCSKYPNCNSIPFGPATFSCQCGRSHYTHNNSGYARITGHSDTDMVDKYFGQEIGEYDASDA